MKDSEFISFRIRCAGVGYTLRLGRRGATLCLAAACLLFVLLVQGIFAWRQGISELRELKALRDRATEQRLALTDLSARIEGLEGEVDRVRMLDARVRSLAGLPPATPAPAGETGAGGAETPGGSPAERFDRSTLDGLARVRRAALEEARTLDLATEKLDRRRLLLESVPSLWPVRAAVSSPFGVRLSPFTDTEVFHHGLDLSAPSGTPVGVAAAGTVARSGYDSLFGNVVVVDHGYGYRTLYGHLSARLVSEGDLVSAGDPVGRVGSTGRSTGPHLHYEVRVHGLPVNPLRFLD